MKKISLLLLVWSWGCSSPNKGDDRAFDAPVLAVDTAAIHVHSFHEVIHSSGILLSKSEVKLAFKTGGMIHRSHVREGQHVRAGQLLAELDLSEIEAQANQARIGYEKAVRDFERADRMFSDHAITETVLKDAKSGLDIAREALAVATYNEKLSKIHAPTHGRILMQLAEQGELIAPFAPMFILGTGDQAHVVNVGLTDRDIVKVSVGDRAEVVLDAYPGEIFEGKVVQVAQMITPSAGTFSVEIEINPRGQKLISGFVGQVSLYTGKSTKALAVPVEALVNAHGENADLYLYSSGRAVRRTVKVGKIYGRYVAINNGINPGDTLITRGSGFVSEGDIIQVHQP